MARTIEIPRDQWFSYFERLSRQAGECTVRLEVENRELGDQKLTGALPLLGIELEQEGADAGAIDVTVSVEADRGAFGHRVTDAKQVYALLDEETGNIACLAIEESGGGKTLITFERPLGIHGELQPAGQPAAP